MRHLARHWPLTFAACVLLGLSACASFEADSSVRLPAPSALATAPTVDAEDDTPPLPPAPTAAESTTPLPITLSAALALSDANPLDIRIADEQVRIAAARLDAANVLWVPDLSIGADYYRHDGQIQDIIGTVFTTSRSAVLVGAGPNAIVPVTDAVYAPLAGQQVVKARQAQAQAVRNDTTLDVAVAYFDVQQSRGELAGALDALKRAEDLVQRTEKLAPGLVPDLEVNRAKAEAARRRQGVETGYERWQVASAELTRLLRLRADTVVAPAEPPGLAVELIDTSVPVDELLAVALTHRPELAAHQAVVQAALVRVTQERKRPFLPTLAVRSVGSNTPNLAGGYFGGGINDYLGQFGARLSVNIQAIWELQNLGFGNRALVRESQAESRRVLLELLRTQDRVAAEVVQAHEQLVRSARRVEAAKDGVENAVASAEKNLVGLGQTKRVGEQLVLLVRPQEAVAAVSALDQAYRDYYQAIADQNRAQFRLYRSLGHPAQTLLLNPEPDPQDPQILSNPSELPDSSMMKRSPEPSDLVE